MKILLAAGDPDFAEASVKALTTQIPARDHQVRVLHVVAPITVAAPPEMAIGYAPELDDLIRQGREFVEQLADDLRAAGFKVDTAVVKGDVRTMILDSAAEWGADLIVVGSHAHGAGRFLLGSVAESVARHARCSVEIVRTQAPGGAT